MMVVKGAGGGKAGGGGGGITEQNDTLSSVAVARFVELIGEGPIGGLVNGEYSIYLDGVPLRSLEGTPNYKPFSYVVRPGTQDQEVIPGFGGVQQENAVGVKILKTSGKLIRSVSDADADAVRVTVSVNGLTHTTDKGEIQGTKVEYKISVRVTGTGSWVEYPFSLNGKTGSVYQKSHEIPIASLGPGPYQVAVERVTVDSASALTVNAIYWDSYAVINFEQYAYPNSALVAVQLDARYFNTIPARTYHVKGLLVRVPMNYDPETRVYATTGPGTTMGGWDGSFKVAYTNNPAWCYYDIATHPRYGVGKYVSSLQISKWQMYEIGRYCDEKVPTGNSLNVFDVVSNPGLSASGKALAAVPATPQNTEPRFTLNCVINTLDDAYKVLNNLSSVFRGMTYWRAGSVMVTQDRPGSPRHIFTNANVEGGIFNYEGSSRSQRHTVAQVGWNDPAEDFKQKYEYIEDRAGIVRYGVRSTDVIAFGCTSRSQARRVGLWLLYTERLETDAITFSTGLDASDVEMGEIVTILDVHRLGARWAGKVFGSTASSIVTDAPVHLVAGAYTVMVMNRDGSSSVRPLTITTTGDYTVLTVSADFSETPAHGAIWCLSSTTVKPLLARVMKVAQKGAAGLTLTCLQHNPSKYEAIELGTGYDVQDYTFLSYKTVPIVSGLNAVEVSYRPEGGAVVTTNVEISWNAINDPLIRGFQTTMIGTNGQKYIVPETRLFTETVRDVVPGDYEITVRVVNQLGIVGGPATFNLTVYSIDSIPVPDAGTMTATISQAGWVIGWPPATDPSITAFELRIGGTNWDSATSLFKGFTDRCRIPFQLVGSYTLRLRCWAGTRKSSNDSLYTLVVNNPGVATLVSSHVAVGSVEIEFADATTSQPLDFVEFRRGDGFDSYGTATPAGAAAGTARSHTVVFPNPGTWRVFWRAVDKAGNAGPTTYDDVVTTLSDIASILTELTGEIRITHLHKTLATPIASIAPLIRVVEGLSTSVVTEVKQSQDRDVALATQINRLHARSGTSSADLLEEKIVRATNDTAIAKSVTTLQASVDGSLASISESFSAQADINGYVGSLYTVRAQVTSSGRTVMGGFGLSATSGGTAGPTIDFGVLANRFWVGAPGGLGLDDVSPFVIQTTDVTVNGVLVPKGVYMDAVYIKNVNAILAKFGTAWINNAMIGDDIKSPDYLANTSGWIVRRDGTAEFFNVFARGNITATSLNAATGTFTGSLSAARGTFSGSLTADAVNAVDTLNIAGEAVTIPRTYADGGSYTMGGTYSLILSYSFSSSTPGRVVIIWGASQYGTPGTSSGVTIYNLFDYAYRVKVNGTIVRSVSGHSGGYDPISLQAFGDLVSGSNTVTIEALCSAGNPSFSVANQSMVLIGAKR